MLHNASLQTASIHLDPFAVLTNYVPLLFMCFCCCCCVSVPFSGYMLFHTVQYNSIHSDSMHYITINAK